VRNVGLKKKRKFGKKMEKKKTSFSTFLVLLISRVSWG
jgi:hypothetical protein